MRNVTITLDDETARWARLEAARRDTSVSRLVGQILREQMVADEAYESAMEAYLSRPAKTLSAKRTRYPRRGDLYDRAVR